jgi:hypothetical protein
MTLLKQTMPLNDSEDFFQKLNRRKRFNH